MKFLWRTREFALPLLVGTFLLRVNGGASSLMIGRFLALSAPRSGSGITNFQVGLLSVAYFVVELILSPVMGSLSDRWGRRPFLTLGPLLGLIYVTLLFFTPLGHSFPYLLSLQMLAGVSSAMQVPTVLSYLADYTAQKPALRIRVMSFYELVTSGGLAVGVAAGGFAWDIFGRSAFLLLGLCYLLAAGCMLFVPSIRRVVDVDKMRSLAVRYWGILRSVRLFLFIPAWISFFALIGIWLSAQLTFILSSRRYLPGQVLMGSLHGMKDGGHLSLVLGAVVLLFGLSLLFWAFFLSHVPRIVLMLSSVGGVYLVCLALTGLNHTLSGHPLLEGSWILLLGAGIFAGSSFAPAALAYLADLSEGAARDRGLLMGLYSVFLGLGQLVGNGLGGLFAERWGFDGLIYLTALLAGVALISLLFLYRQERRRPLITE